jgi:glycogen phosphorylase
MSLIEEGPSSRCAWPIWPSSAAFRSTASPQLHSDLLTEGLFRDFYELWPEKFNNKTNGVTPRRWMASCNPGLNALLTTPSGRAGSPNWTNCANAGPLREDAAFPGALAAVKHANKVRLASLVEADVGVTFNPEALFDVQVKRIHEYKRQLLNILHVIHLYDRIKRGDAADWTPRCVLLGGKAAPGLLHGQADHQADQQRRRSHQ